MIHTVSETAANNGLSVSSLLFVFNTHPPLQPGIPIHIILPPRITSGVALRPYSAAQSPSYRLHPGDGDTRVGATVAHNQFNPSIILVIPGKLTSTVHAGDTRHSEATAILGATRPLF